jgi:glutamine synthetase
MIDVFDLSRPSCAEYIWIDGTNPVKKLRSKTKIISSVDCVNIDFEKVKCGPFPEWTFDGSSTSQAKGKQSDLILRPANAIIDPIRGGNNHLVLCEVFERDGITPSESNTRAVLRKTLADGANKLESWWGFEQEYVLLKDGNILGWPNRGYPSPQGPYYCGVGSDEVVGREIVERHLEACVDADIMICGVNAEVMLGQWEFQVGHRDIMTDLDAGPLRVSDHLWFARYLLYRISEGYNIYATLDPKPEKGDWAGSGCHINVSYNKIREKGGPKLFSRLMEWLNEYHVDHMSVYGVGNRDRLTGKNETERWSEFSWGESDRTASIRIPPSTINNEYKGYFEDRRPAANVDPYEACNVMLKTIAMLHEYDE